MNCQLPEKFKKEEKELQKKLLSQDTIGDVQEFIEKNASKEYKDYIAKKNKRVAELLKKGIIEN